MRKQLSRQVLTFFVVSSCIVATPAQAQDPGDEGPEYSFGVDVAPVSKYIWRGQRLTNDWSLQPSVTVGYGGFSFNAWGTMDLTSVNEGDSLFIQQNPNAPVRINTGLEGKFSEVDYTFSYAHSFESVSLDVGAITYTFPERSASLAATTELYGSVSLDSMPMAPSVTVYMDVDETRENEGSTGMYLQLAGGHSFDLGHPVASAVDISFSLGFANSGFSEFFYGATESGAHDFNYTVSLPLALGENWSFTPFFSYSALLGGFRDQQFLDPRDVFRGTAGLPSDSADTLWGGFTLSLAF